MRAARIAAALAVLVLVVIGGCARQFDLQPQVPLSCSQIRLDAAAAMHEEAKHFLVRHFKERDRASLQFAFYATQDTEDLTKSIRLCFDFDREYRRRGTEIIRSARILRKVVVGNMRDNDPSVLVHLLGSAYDEVFRSDIH